MNSSVRKTNWHHEIEEDLKQAGSSKDMSRGKFRNKIKNIKFEVKEKKEIRSAMDRPKKP